jgi:pSer/pThr/pTyr-binding forkhead associated (FHA) protein
MTANLEDNPVIHQFKSINEQSKELGIEFSKDDIEITPTGKDIIEIRKIRNSQKLDQIVIGRSPKSDIVFDDIAVSQTHAYIYVSTSDLKYYLVDLESLNGTFLNSNKLQSHEKYGLSNECEITFGSTTKVAFFSSGGFFQYLSAIAGRQKV